MKVLEGPSQWTRQIKCRTKHCRSKLEIEASDVKWGGFGANYGGDSPQLAFYVECPGCAQPLMLDSEDLPRTVYDAGHAWWSKRER